MARPTIPQTTKLRIGLLYGQLGSIDKVLDELWTPDVPIARGTIAKYARLYKDRWLPVLRPIEWGALTDCGLPAEALDILLRTWREWATQVTAAEDAIDYLQETVSAAQFADLGAKGLTPRTHGLPQSIRPTVVEARAWWRAHCAVPDAAPRVILRAAFPFTLRETFRLLGDEAVPRTDDDLWGWLAARAWEGMAQRKEYARFVLLGRIPLVRLPIAVLPGAEGAGGYGYHLPYRLADLPAGIAVDWPETGIEYWLGEG